MDAVKQEYIARISLYEFRKGTSELEVSCSVRNFQ